MSVLSSNNQAKQKLSISKPQQRLFDTFNTKNNLAKECGFIQLVSFNACTFISYLIVWSFILNVLYFSWDVNRIERRTIEQLNGIPQDPVFI